MAPTPAVYTSYTGLINPSGVEPALTHEQVWEGLGIKVEAAQDFVGAIISTDVVSKHEDDHRRGVTIREVVFKEGNQRVKEEVIHYYPTKHIFVQANGSRVQNIISTGASGELLLTFDFEWLHPGISKEDLAKEEEKAKQMSKGAVESTIGAIREMVKNGRIK